MHEEKAEDVVGHASITAEECDVLSVTANADVVVELNLLEIVEDAEHAEKRGGAQGAQSVSKAENHRARLPGQAGPHCCVRQENKAVLPGQAGPQCFVREEIAARSMCGRECAYRPQKGLGVVTLGEGAEEKVFIATLELHEAAAAVEVGGGCLRGLGGGPGFSHGGCQGHGG